MCFVELPASACLTTWHDRQSGEDGVWTDAENTLKYVGLIEMFTKE